MSKQYLYIPCDTQDWEVWVFNPAAKGQMSAPVLDRILPDAAQNPPDGIVMALPVSQCLLLPIWVSAADPALHTQMFRAQLEKRGLPVRNGFVFSYTTVCSIDHRVLGSVTLLPSDFPDALCIPKAKSYVIAADLLPLPENQIVLWRERGHLVLVGTRGCEPVYAQVLARHPGENCLTVSMVREIRMIQWVLMQEQVVETVSGVTLWGEWTTSEAAGGELNLPIHISPRPGPAASRIVAAMSRPPLLPLPLQAAQVTVDRREKKIRLALIAAVGYVGLILLIAFYLHLEQAKAAKLMIAVNRDRPAADTLSRTVASWRAMEPAINPRLYIIEQFYQSASVLPGAGVRFDSFETQQTTIKIHGTARNAPTVFRFVERLKKNPSLSDYQWKMGQPKLQKDDTAEFKLEGTLRYGPSK